MEPELMTPALPLDLVLPTHEGLITVWNYLLAAEPELMALLDDPFSGPVGDEMTARDWAFRVGYHPKMRVLGSDLAAKVGLPDIGLYPADLLDAIFPALGRPRKARGRRRYTY